MNQENPHNLFSPALSSRFKKGKHVYWFDDDSDVELPTVICTIKQTESGIVGDMPQKFIDQNDKTGVRYSE